MRIHRVSPRTASSSTSRTPDSLSITAPGDAAFAYARCAVDKPEASEVDMAAPIAVTCSERPTSGHGKRTRKASVRSPQNRRLSQRYRTYKLANGDTIVA